MILYSIFMSYDKHENIKVISHKLDYLHLGA